MRNKSFDFYLLILFFSFSTYLIANENAGKNSKPSEEIKPKSEINEIEVTGLVTELITFHKKDGRYIELRQYYITNKHNKLFYLINKVGDKEVQLSQYTGRKILAKGKSMLKIELNVIDKKGNSNIFTQLDSLEIKEKG